MNLRNVRDILVRADVLSTTPIASGYPYWLPFGTRVAERIDALYSEELKRRIDFVEMEPPLLVDRQSYVDAVSASYDYQNMLWWQPPDAPAVLVRPDNLFAATQALAKTPCHLPVVMQGSLYRSETGNLWPLVRDRHMWRTTQVVHWLDGADATEAYLLHTRVFGRLMRRLGIPTIFVDCPPLREHSERRMLTFTPTAVDELTLTSTGYLLSPSLVERLGLSGQLLDFGFTAKLLAVAVALTSDEVGLVLPTDLAPDVVVVGYRDPSDREAAERLADDLRAVTPRVAVDHRPWGSVRRSQRRHGTPILVLVDSSTKNHLITRFDGASQALSSDARAHLREAIDRHDRALWTRALACTDAALAEARVVRLGHDAPSDWSSLGRCVGYPEPPEDLASDDRPNVFSPQARYY